MGQLVYNLTGIHPVYVVNLNDCEVLIELGPTECNWGSQEIQTLISWEGLNVEAIYILSSKRQLMDIARE